MFDQEEDEVTEKFKPYKPSYVLIAIDTDSSMFELRRDANSEEDTTSCAFKDALYACYQVADSLILTSGIRNYNEFGVVTVNSDPNKATLVEVKTNMLDIIKVLKNEYEKSDEDLHTQYIRSDNIDLGAFFLMCRRKLRDIDGDFYQKTIIFITNDDNPIGDDAQLKFTVMNEAKYLDVCEVRLELLTMRTDFNYEKFWNEFFNVFRNPPKTEELCENREGLLERLTNSIIYRYTALKCKLFPFKNDFKKHLQCKRVNFIKQAKLYNTHRMSKDGKMLMRIKSDQAPLVPEYRVNLGIYELERMSLKDKYDIYGNNLPLGLHVQYVADRQTEVGLTVGRPCLLMVDSKEELSHYYENFWSYCVDNNKVLVCLKKFKHPCPIRYVELIPKFANDQKMFLVKNLPFVEEILFPNKVTEKPGPVVRDPTEDQLRAVQNLIAQLTFEYEPSMLSNGSYCKKKDYIKSKFLDTTYVEPDDCAGDLSAIDEDVGNEMRAVKSLFDFNSGGKGKRKAGGSSKPTAKRGRTYKL